MCPLVLALFLALILAINIRGIAKNGKAHLSWITFQKHEGLRKELAEEAGVGETILPTWQCQKV